MRMNAEGLRLTQCRAEDVIGHDHWEVWPELHGTHAETVYRRVMDTGVTAIVELMHLLPDGRRVWIETRAHRSFDGGIAFFFRDITERRTTQEQLTIADRRKDEFLAMLAHELRNPLAPIGAAADLLQIARLDEAKVRQTSQIIGRQVRHMTSLVDDLLDVSRVTRGLVELHAERLDIRQVANEAIEQVMPLIRSRRQHLALVLAPAAPMVMGDRKRLVQVLANLLNNAAKYTPEGGHITLATEVRAGQVLLQVKDDGIGMAPELVARAFELFSQAERSSDRSLGGLGLGLALVKSLVDLHHGSVACASAGQGEGSTFTVCLPRWTPGHRLRRRQRSALRTTRRPPASCASWWSTTLWMRRRCWRCCSNRAGIRSMSSMLRYRRWPPASTICRTYSCSISACPTSTASNWPRACAPGPVRSRRCWWPLPATARNRTGPAPRPPASTTIWSSRSTCRS